MKPITLGRLPDGKDLTIDLGNLIKTRLLVQANSGGGKSYLLRLLAENAIGQMQTIILDPEGEFSSLAELHRDLLIIASDAEIKPSPKSAALLARRLCEIGASAVIDLFDLKLDERKLFVKSFLDSLINVPRTLWHPIMVIVDEAQIFAPEKGEGEAVSKDAVVSLMTLGRKRGFCGVLATQRLSRLHKDAANVNNVLIGRTSLDTDQARALRQLGDTATRTELRGLKPGEFFAFGAALNVPSVVKVSVAPVKTKHPEAGDYKGATSSQPRSKEIEKLISQLKDLPQEAAQEARSFEEARAEIARLKRELAAKPKPALTQADIDAEIKATIEASDRMWRGRMNTREKMYVKIINNQRKFFDRIAENADAIRGLCEQSNPKLDFPDPPETADFKFLSTPMERPKGIPVNRIATRKQAPPPPQPRESKQQTRSIVDFMLDKPKRAILTVLAQNPEGCEKTRIAILSGYSHTSGSFRNSLSSLRTSGAISGTNNERMQITDDGLISLGDFEPLPSGEDLLNFWLKHPALGKPDRAILSYLYCRYPETVSKADIAAATLYEVTSGSFRNALSRLRTLKLIEGMAEMAASEVFFT
jgi:hypothetical protein